MTQTEENCPDLIVDGAVDEGKEFQAFAQEEAHRVTVTDEEVRRRVVPDGEVVGHVDLDVAFGVLLLGVCINRCTLRNKPNLEGFNLLSGVVVQDLKLFIYLSINTAFGNWIMGIFVFG